jgi:hypothetical protein
VANIKVVPNILICLHAKFHIFLRYLNISFYFIFSPALKIKWKRNFKKGKASRAIFLHVSLLLQRPQPISTREPDLLPVIVLPTLMTGTHLSGLSPPNPPLLLPVWQSRPNCRHQVSHSSPPLCCEDARGCGCHLESSHQLWCNVASHRRCPPAPTAACRCARWDAAPGPR